MEQKVINCPHCGKIISKNTLTGKRISSVTCSQCGCAKCFRDGFRHTHKGKIQRYLCRECGYRFS